MNKRILFINNSAASSTAPGLIARAGYDVHAAYNPAAGLGETGKNYDLIILHEDPHAESWIFCEEIRRLSAAPLIVISFNADAETCVKAINAGADYFIRKSFGPLELLARINSLLQRTPNRQPAPPVSIMPAYQ
jgi:DNA-binding response OmpR family regulator